ncbi:MAG: hypothetical protein ACYTG6_07255 [Planctomycetota bacterium]|jgi:tetratricopeptide (TPR) repeat protein
MRALTFVIAVLFASVLFAEPAQALDDIILNDGQVRRAEILEVNADSIRVRGRPRSGGVATLTVPASRLDPHFFYGLRDARLGDDVQGRIQLALWAVEHGLFSRAKLQIQKAAEIDKEAVAQFRAEELPKIRDGIVAKVLASAKADMEEGRLEAAETKIEAILARAPDTPAGAEARDLLPVLDAKLRDQREAEKQAQREQLAEEARKAAEERDRLLEPANSQIEKAQALVSRALRDDSASRSLDHLRSAISTFGAARKRLQDLAENHADDAELVAEAQKGEQVCVDGMIEAHEHRADIFIWRGNLTSAREELAEARKLDPDNDDLDSLEQRIDQGETDTDWGLRWRRAAVGGGRPGGRFPARGGGVRGGGGRRR